MLSPKLSPQEIRRLLKASEQYELSSEAVKRLKWFLYAAEHDGNVSLTCRHFGISRSTFLRWIERFDINDTRSLEEHSRRPHTVRTPDTDERTIAIITAIRKEQPMIGKEAIGKILMTGHGIELSTATIGRIISRHGLFFGDTKSHREKRMHAKTHTHVSDGQPAIESESSSVLLPSLGLSS